MKTRTKYIFFFILAALLLCGCATEKLEVGGTGIDYGDEIAFTIPYSVPGMEVLTKADHPNDAKQSAVVSVFLLAYKVDEQGVERFYYSKKATNLDDVAKTFTMRLYKGKDGEKFTFDFLFNLPSATFDNAVLKYTPGVTTRDSIQDTFYGNNFGAGSGYMQVWSITSTSFPMWAGIESPMAVTAQTTFPTLKVIRDYARIDIGLNMDADDEATGIANFEWTYVGHVFYSARQYYIPRAGSVVDGEVVGLGNPATYAPTTTISAITSVQNPIQDNRLISSFLPVEANPNGRSNPKESYSIIIGGYYTPPGEVNPLPQVHYYRINLRVPNDADTKLPILRNHKYRINIQAITGPGFTTLTWQNVRDAEPANVIYDLAISEAGDINHVVYNNTYFLGVSDIAIDCAQSGTSTIKLKTDYSGGWKLASIKDDEGNDVTWISASPTSGSTTATSGTESVVFQVLQTNSGEPRTATATFTAGTLSIEVLLRQSGTWTLQTNWNGAMLLGDGDNLEVYLWGNRPGNLWVRANSYKPDGDNAGWHCVSRDTIEWAASGYLSESNKLTAQMEILGNAWVSNQIRQVQLEYSLDGGTTWTVFQQGPQGKGHFRSKMSGRIVALYDYSPGEEFLWSEAMGVDPRWNGLPKHPYYYSEVSIPYTFSWAPIPLNVVGLSQGNNRSALYYIPTEPTGCADYWEEGYEDIYPRGNWRLPSLTELLEMHRYHDHIGDLARYNNHYWSSTDQHVTGGTYPGSYLVYIRPGSDKSWWASSGRNGYYAHVRCVYGDPDPEVIQEQYPNWYYNPNTKPPEDTENP